MEPRVQLITLGVRDVAVARQFYVEGLGWPTVFDVPGEITFIQVGHGRLLGLFELAALAADAGRPLGSPASAPMSLAQIVATDDEVRAALAAAAAAGGEVVKPAQLAAFGGYHGYFADPDGFLWEVATNSGWVEAPDGTISLVPIT
jgi:catechol 2,3-dioxygenase-like lactoylglutathione lyase family enzyme